LVKSFSGFNVASDMTAMLSGPFVAVSPLP
jgi:hypothetical protein